MSSNKIKERKKESDGTAGSEKRTEGEITYLQKAASELIEGVDEKKEPLDEDQRQFRLNNIRKELIGPEIDVIKEGCSHKISWNADLLKKEIHDSHARLESLFNEKV